MKLFLLKEYYIIPPHSCSSIALFPLLLSLKGWIHERFLRVSRKTGTDCFFCRFPTDLFPGNGLQKSAAIKQILFPETNTQPS